MRAEIPTMVNPKQARKEPGKIGFSKYALHFDGAEDYGNYGVGMAAETYPLAFELMVNFDTIAQDAALLNFDVTDPNTDIVLGIYATGDEILVGRLTFKAGLNGIANYIIPRRWQQWNVNFADPTTIALSLNAIEQPVIAVADWYSRAGNIVAVGCRPGDKWLLGSIAYLRIYTGILTPNEIRWNLLHYHNPVHPDRLLLWSPMDEGTGLIVNDHSGLGNDGALLPALTPPVWKHVRQWEIRSQTQE